MSGGYYIAGGTLGRDAACYIPRRADHEIFDGLLDGEFCYVLTPRQMGKSSLMVRTARRLKEVGLSVAVLDLTSIGQNVSVEQWYGGLLSQVGQQLEMEEDLLAYWRNMTLLGPLQRWMSAILNQVLPKIRDRLIIFIDEIDAVRSMSFNTDEFFAGIREFFNRRTVSPDLNKLTFCLLGVATPADLIRNPLMTPFNIGQRIELLDFSESEAMKLAEGLNRDEEQSRRILRRVFHWTNGHPYLTQRLCQRISTDPAIGRESDVDRVCEELFLSPQARERDDNLLFVRERLLRSDIDHAELLNQYSRVLGQRRLTPILDDEHSPVFTVLKLSGITRLEEGSLKVRNRIYGHVFDQNWIRENMPDGELRRQKRAFLRGALKTSGVLLSIILIISVLGIYSWQQRNAAIEEELKAARMLYAANMNLAAQAWETANINGLKVLLRGDGIRHQPEYHKGFEWRFFNGLLNGEIAQYRHDDIATTARFSPDGKMLATAGKDETIKIWDLSTGSQRMSLKGHTDQIWRVAYSPDGRSLASAGWDCRVKVWDTATGREVVTLNGHEGRVCGVDYSPDGRILATSGWDKLIILWDVKTGKRLKTLRGHDNWVWSVIFSRDGKRLVSTGEDKTVRIWDIDRGVESRVLDRHKTSVYSSAFSVDGRNLFTGSSGGEIFRWDTTSYEMTGAFIGQNQPVNGLSVSVNGRYLASAGVDRIIRIWDPQSLELIDTIRGHSDEIRSIEYSRHQPLLATASDDFGVRLWDTGKTGARNMIPQGNDHISGAKLTRDGSTLAVANDTRINLWDMRTRRSLGVIATDFRINDLTFSPDEKIIAAALRDQTVGIWNVRTHQLIGKLSGYAGWVFSIRFSPDGKLIATGDRYHKAILWDAATLRRLATFDLHNNGVKSVAFSPDGKFLATAGDDHVIHIWDVATRSLHSTLLGHKNEIWTISFSPDGESLASAGYDRTIRIWNWKLGIERLTMEGHSTGIKKIVYSPDGTRLASGSADGMIKLWDPDTGLEMTTLARQTTAVTDLEFSSQNDLLVSGGLNGMVYLWWAR